MAKLKPDCINWVLNLNAKQVHTEIAALEKEERVTEHIVNFCHPFFESPRQTPSA